MSLVLGPPPRAPRSRPLKPGAKAPGVGKGTLASEKPTGAPTATRPDEARRTTRGQDARQRGTQPTTTTAQDQVPRTNGCRVPQTRTARATPKQVRGARNADPPPPKEPEEQRRGREAETRRRPRSTSKAETRARRAEETKRPGLDHPGRTKQQEPPPPGQEHPGTSGGPAPTKGATRIEQGGGATATPDWIIQGQVAVGAPDWNIRGGASSRSGRPLDWSIEGQEEEDAPDRMIRGKTRRRGHNCQDTDGRGKAAGRPGQECPGQIQWEEPPPPGQFRKQHKRPRQGGAPKQGSG